jgi:hypothetical protein
MLQILDQKNANFLSVKLLYVIFPISKLLFAFILISHLD